MVDFVFGITLKFEKKKRPFAIGQVFYDKGNHLIELHDPDSAAQMIKGLIPPLPEGMQTPTEPKEKEKEEKKETHGIA